MEKLRTYLNSLSTDDQFFFAKRAGTTVGYLRRRIHDGGNISLNLAAALERESRGAVTVEDLRPYISVAYMAGTPKARRHRA